MKTRILLAASLTLASASGAFAQSTFPDVPDNHWAAKAVQRLAEAGIIEGLPATQEQGRAARTPIASAPSPEAARAPKAAARLAVVTDRRVAQATRAPRRTASRGVAQAAARARAN